MKIKANKTTRRHRHYPDVICWLLVIAVYILFAAFRFHHTEIIYTAPTCNVGDIATLDAPTSTYIGDYYITGYNPYDAKQCGKADGITASGKLVTIGKTISMKGVSFGTRIYIQGLGEYIVEDRGVRAGCIDVACADNASCYAITSMRAAYLVEATP
jgi:hypothetical protein